MLERCFEIDDILLESIDDYHVKTMLMQNHKIEKKPISDLKSAVNDDLVYHVPIYDMGSRKYAAFCSLPEALWKKEKDVKGNGMHFLDHQISDISDWFFLFYAFRVCGSGINYKPKNNSLFDSTLNSHGFGNFWVIESILKGKYTKFEWINDLELTNKPFTNNKGYLLPQFVFDNLKNGHLKHFIINYSIELVDHILNELTRGSKEIYQVTDIGNKWLNERGFKKQNFVLTAFAADISEYFPSLVSPKSMVYAGTQATRCIKSVFKKTKKVSEFEFVNSVLGFQADRYSLNPIDCEDSRNCDVVRYWKEYQSPDHVRLNGSRYENNTTLKKTMTKESYEKLPR